jgi:hypothetical protein
VTTIVTPDQRESTRRESGSRSNVMVTVNPWGVLQPLERTYGPPCEDGFGAKRAVRKYGEVLRRLAE